MIIVLVGKQLRGISITVPAEEQQSSVASVPTGGLGGNPPHSP